MNLKKTLESAQQAQSGDLLVTPRLDTWLARNPNMDPSTETVEIVLRGELATPQRDRRMTFSASSRGACRRAQVFEFTDLPSVARSNPDLHAKFHDGTFRHMRWQLWLIESGILDEVEVSAQEDQLWLTGTIDGIGLTPDHLIGDYGPRFGWELKGCNSRSFRFVLDQGPNESHLLQIHAYFLLRPDLETWSLVYESKDTNEWKEFVVRRDQAYLDQVRREIQDLQSYVLSQDLPPILPDCKRKQGPYKTCPFAHACLETHEWPKRKRMIKRSSRTSPGS